MATILTAQSSVSVKHDALDKAASIYEYTHSSASSLLVSFDDAKAKRGTPRGILTDQEQDILRAVLVMCCAGLDATLKQAVRDTLQLLLKADDEVRRGFEKFIQKKLAGAAETLEQSGGGVKFLSKILASTEPRIKLIEEYILDLTGDSLQSAEQVMATIGAFGLNVDELAIKKSELTPIFRIRNKIIHELDINLDGKPRKRIVRGQQEMLDIACDILSVAKKILEALDKKLV